MYTLVRSLEADIKTDTLILKAKDGVIYINKDVYDNHIES